MSSSAHQLGSDQPIVDPSDDAFGYAAFASQLAAAIVSNQAPQGLVLAVHGEWGSGKSSLLNFIKHDLKLLPYNERPILVDFNPWWFEGREQIASQLLEQFSAQLPDRLKGVRTLAKLVGSYSKEIASTIADYSGYAWIKSPLANLLGRIPGLKVLTEKTGIPQIKKKVAEALKSTGKRFVFFIDDIDRLTPDEARDLFRAIKALADFPEVVYVLFFDREAVANALTASLKMEGEAYLEKIVQAPFHLPAIDKGLLHQKLFTGLDAILESRRMPFPFDSGRWFGLFSEGLGSYIGKPRDIIRLLNAISVTYPPLAGEVNPVDFIALEFLRVFEPGVYGVIRDERDFFCGSRTRLDLEKHEEKAYFVKWRDSLPEPSRARLVAVVGRLFPKAAQALSDYPLTEDSGEWRKELRPCSADCFGVYFQFGVPAGHVSRAELEQLVSQDSSAGMADVLLKSKELRLPDGHSKARDLIDRLRDFDQLDAGQAAKLIEALISNVHVLTAGEGQLGSFFSQFGRWQVLGLAIQQMERLNRQERQDFLTQLASTSPSLLGLVALADIALQSKRDPSKASRAMIELEDGFPESLSAAVGRRLDEASLQSLMKMPELDFIVHRWIQWGDPDRIRGTFKPLVADDDGLLLLLDSFVRTGRQSSGAKTSAIYQLSMKPLMSILDAHDTEPRVRSLQSRTDLTARQRAATDRFIQGLRRIEEGKDPDGFHWDDTED